MVGNDGTQGAAAAVYLKDVLQAQKVFLVDDGTTYGAGIIAETKKGRGALVAGEDKVQEKQSNFDATISKIKAAGADAVAYGGYTNEAAPLLKQMRAGGVTGSGSSVVPRSRMRSRSFITAPFRAMRCRCPEPRRGSCASRG